MTIWKSKDELPIQVDAGQPKDKLAEIMEKIRGIDTFDKLAEFTVEVGALKNYEEFLMYGFLTIDIKNAELFIKPNGNIEYCSDDEWNIIAKNKTPQQMAMIIAGLRGW